MSIAEGRSPKLLAADRTSVITNSILLTRRIRELQRRRQALVGRQDEPHLMAASAIASYQSG